MKESVNKTKYIFRLYNGAQELDLKKLMKEHGLYLLEDQYCIKSGHRFKLFNI